MNTQRLNGIIRAWEQGRPAFAAFSQLDRRAAVEFSTSPYDAIIYEMEHNPWDIVSLRDSMQYLLSRKQILDAGSLAPAVTPICRIPPNGNEMDQAYAKQALDCGVYGVVWPHITTVEEARNAVSACRYPRPESAPNYEPAGIRGDAPTAASRYWGLDPQAYYKKADVWPLNPDGEILVFLMIESVKGMNNLDEILSNVPGIGCVLIGEGDLSQNLGFPRQYEHPVVLEAMAKIVATCQKHGVPVGHPHVTAKNVERVLEEGFQFLMSAPVRTFKAIDMAREIVGAKIENTGPGAAY
jgi:4-hydroxy-2-oxoheptanedioate aldolase